MFNEIVFKHSKIGGYMKFLLLTTLMASLQIITPNLEAKNAILENGNYLNVAKDSSCSLSYGSILSLRSTHNSKHPSAFIPDAGSILSFTNAFEPGGPLPAGSLLTPFVVASNGVVIQGTSIIADGILTDFMFAPIIVMNPIFGTYHIGVQVTLSEDFAPGLINLTSQVVSDRVGPAPAEITVVGEEDTLSPVFPLLAGNQYQIMAEFAYGPANIP